MLILVTDLYNERKKLGSSSRPPLVTSSLSGANIFLRGFAIMMMMMIIIIIAIDIYN
jgi:hypothetical protein